jgi:hypothetical protein
MGLPNLERVIFDLITHENHNACEDLIEFQPRLNPNCNAPLQCLRANT